MTKPDELINELYPNGVECRIQKFTENLIWQK